MLSSVLYFPLLAENKGARAHAIKDAILAEFNSVVSKRVPAGLAPYVIDFIVLDKKPKPSAAKSAAAAAAVGDKKADAKAAKPTASATDSPFEIIVGELNPFHDYSGAGVGSGSEVRDSFEVASSSLLRDVS